MQRKPRLKAAWKLVAVIAVGALVLAACGSSTTAGTTTTPGGANTTRPATIQRGGTVYWAESPASKPTWIFPFASITYFSVTNLTQFQELMYRPLYWFGPPTSASPSVDFSLSLANAPVFSNGNKTVTINLKGWKFRDGQAVDAQSVIFWMNMMKAVGASDWAGFAPGPGQFPTNVSSYSATSPTASAVTFNLNAAYNPTWFLYNELSQITPMTEAWDVTSLTAAAGSGKCGTVLSGKMTGNEKAIVKACTAVWTFDTDDNGKASHAQMAGDIDTYGTNPLWADGADGPWYMTAFSASSGEVTFKPNADYNGPQKPYISEFVELPYTSSASVYNALVAGGANAPDVGLLPAEDTPQKPAGTQPLQAGPNNSALSSRYNLVVEDTWSINYFPLNFDSTDGADGHAGMVFRQLYFRQALQELINQQGIIQTYEKGYGVPTYGPAPVYPPNSFASGDELKTGGPYPFSEANAIALLKSHGWTVKPGGTTTCTSAGTGSTDCGAGIPAGTPLKFSEEYYNVPLTQNTTQYEVSEWAKAGIQVKATPNTFSGVIGLAVPCVPNVTKACQSWDLANWGGGWLFAPDYLPTGEEIFASGAGSNTGDYNSTMNNTLIGETNKSSSSSIFTTWENYLAEQLPVVWQPNSSYQWEIAKNLGGVTPISALQNLDPEYWYFTSK
jgi:peptide/nickel transport system substrate-binding protein